MSLVSDLEKLTENGFTKLLALLLFISPGLLLLYHFNKPLFMSADILKLALLSAAVILPLFLSTFITISGLVVLGGWGRDIKDDFDGLIPTHLMARVFASLLMAGGQLYIGLAEVYLTKASLHEIEIAILGCVILFPATAFAVEMLIVPTYVWAYKKLTHKSPFPS